MGYPASIFKKMIGLLIGAIYVLLVLRVQDYTRLYCNLARPVSKGCDLERMLARRRDAQEGASHRALKGVPIGRVAVTAAKAGIASAAYAIAAATHRAGINRWRGQRTGRRRCHGSLDLR